MKPGDIICVTEKEGVLPILHGIYGVVRGIGDQLDIEFIADVGRSSFRYKIPESKVTKVGEISD